MGRPRQPLGKSETVCVRLSAQQLGALDALRGGLSRSAYFRGLLLRAERSLASPPVESQPHDPISGTGN